MKIIISNINTSNIDYLSGCLGFAGLIYCDEAIDLVTRAIDCDKVDMTLISMEEFEMMLEQLLDNDFKVEIVK